MPKFPGLSGKEIIRALEKSGFRVARRSGSHVLMKTGEKGCVEPNPVGRPNSPTNGHFKFPHPDARLTT
jgi:hypothetical protein